MAIIHELSPHLADLIAAGEVVERPASVAKELVENAIDAGSTRITVELENGGITYLRIADNGCGMSAEDAPVAFRRHATSKLRTEEDLSAIGTLGFRGEALAAIASVSRIDLFTRQPDSIAGIHLHLEAGDILAQEEAGCPEGTTIIVRDLFYNTPARMKFLKKDFTEAGYILSVVQHAALSHPEIAFTLIRDGKQIFTTDGKGKLITPVFAVFGKEMTANMLEVSPTEHDGMTVHGYIVKPHAGRPNRSMQHFFVNGRYVKSRLMQAALEEAYRNAMITGKYPSCAVFLKLPLHSVDVNVHPAKTEVKFSQEKPVFEAVYIACKNALAAGDNIPQLKHKENSMHRVHEDHLTQEQQRISVVAEPSIPTVQKTCMDDKPKVVSYRSECKPTLEEFVVSVPPKMPPRYMARGVLSSPPIFQCAETENVEEQPIVSRSETIPQTIEKEETKTVSEHTFDPKAQVIGECFHTYLVAEDSDGLILIDKHAAHERILFNQLRTQKHKMPQQQLLTPTIVELPGEEAAAVQEHLELIRKAGFAIDEFGERSFAVRSAPAYIDAADISNVIGELADKLLHNRVPEPDRLDDMLHTVACKAAIKAGKKTSLTELQDLCDRVLADENVRSCPHGRPTVVRLTKYELDKMFKRVNQ